MRNKFWLGFSSPAQVLLVVGVWAMVFVGAFLCATISAPTPAAPARIIRIKAECGVCKELRLQRFLAPPAYDPPPPVGHRVI